MKQIKRLTKLIALALSVACLASCSVSPADGSQGTALPPSSTPIQGGLNPTAPIKDYDFNPLTGEGVAEGYTVGQRPVAVMVNNAYAALPQRGISSAEVIYEMVTEGGVTRLMALFSDYKTVPQVGPVRSARDQHLQLALPTNAIFVHIGSSVYAQNLINQLSYQDIDGMYLGSQCFVFDNARSLAGKGNEHCWFTDAAFITDGMTKNGISPTGSYDSLFKFANKDIPARLPTQGDAPHVKFAFSGAGEVELIYNAETKTYYKTAYAAAQIDELNGATLNFANAFILTSNITLKPDGLCTDFDFSQGTGYYISQGKYEPVIWAKGDPTAPLKIYGADKAELTVNVGKSYVAFVGTAQMETLLMNAAAPPPVVDTPVPEPAPSSTPPIAP